MMRTISIAALLALAAIGSANGLRGATSSRKLNGHVYVPDLNIFVPQLVDGNFPGICWKSSYANNAVAAVEPQCPQGQTLQSDGMCYEEACPSGYYKHGQDRCIQNCPSGYQNNGDGTCTRKAATYGRGAGWVSKDLCNEKEGKMCEINGLLWYPVCDSANGYSNIACCICARDDHTIRTDIKMLDTTPPTESCPAGTEQEEGLCYNPCESVQGFEFERRGSTCWQKTLPGGQDCPDWKGLNGLEVTGLDGMVAFPGTQCPEYVYGTIQGCIADFESSLGN